MTLLNRLRKQLRQLFLLVTFFTPQIGHAQQTIGITQIVDHPSLNAIREGILDELAHEGFVEGKNFHVITENAHGNPTTAAQIAQKFAGLHLDVIVPISTPSAQAIVQQIKDTPIIFAAISDPLAAKVVTSLNHPGGETSGVADIPPIKEQLEFIKKCLPNLKTLGVVYNPGEVNNVSFLENLKALAKKENITVRVAAAPKSADVQAAAQSLITSVDAIFIGNDNTVVSGLEALVKICLTLKKPLFASDPHSVERGALASYSYDQYQIGQQVGKMVIKVLKGQKPGDMPVETPTHLKLMINEKTAEKVNVKCSVK